MTWRMNAIHSRQPQLNARGNDFLSIGELEDPVVARDEAKAGALELPQITGMKPAVAGERGRVSSGSSK